MTPTRKRSSLKSPRSRGVDKNELAQEVLSRYLEDGTRFIEAVNLGLAAAPYDRDKETLPGRAAVG